MSVPSVALPYGAVTCALIAIIVIIVEIITIITIGINITRSYWYHKMNLDVAHYQNGHAVTPVFLKIKTRLNNGQALTVIG